MNSINKNEKTFWNNSLTKDVGFPIPNKENEKRRALLPGDIKSTVAKHLLFEKGYGNILGISDKEYRSTGAQVLERDEICRCSVICNPKPLPTDEYFHTGTILFGWIHAIQGYEITKSLVHNAMSAIAWEEMFDENRHLFWRNNEISGEAAILHAFTYWGRLPYKYKAAVIGNGNVAIGAYRMLEKLGCRAYVYNHKNSHFLRNEIAQYDVIVNAVRWDVFQKHHIVYEEDLKKMRPGSMIVDISCDEKMGIESSIPTTIEKPVYWREGILHYAVDHTPAIFYHAATKSISKVVSHFIQSLVNQRENLILSNATIIHEGRILDERIIRFQAKTEGIKTYTLYSKIDSEKIRFDKHTAISEL